MAVIDPTSLAFLLAESRSMPTHVAGLQLFEPPSGAAKDFARETFEAALQEQEIAPLFMKRPQQTLGGWRWVEDKQFDIEYHVRHSALPEPGRIRELLELVSRLHGTRLARERPLWECHIIEGLADGRMAMYSKVHHALVDGISAMRLMQNVLSPDPDERDMALPFAARARRSSPSAQPEDLSVELSDALAEEVADGLADQSPGRRLEQLATVPVKAARQALAISAEAAGLPGALVKSVAKGLRNDASPLSFHAPKSPFNVTITGSRRFAADDWPMERLRGVAKASGTTVNDVVLAMCGGAVRQYLLDLGDLPDASLVAMVPVGLKSRKAESLAGGGGNAIGAVMAKLGTDLGDPAERLEAISASMRSGKEALASMSPTQILAMSALGMAPALAIPMLHLNGMVRPPFNLIISNVPGPPETQYFNGARLSGTYPVSVPMQGMALNITCNSYADDMAFGLTGCRRSVPRLQVLLTHLDSELGALEKAAGVG